MLTFLKEHWAFWKLLMSPDTPEGIYDTPFFYRVAAIPMQIVRLHRTGKTPGNAKLTWWECTRLVVWGVRHGMPKMLVGHTLDELKLP
jgi:hypothetical protein